MFHRILTVKELPPERLLEAIEKIKDMPSARHTNELFVLTRELIDERTFFLNIPSTPFTNNIAVLMFFPSNNKPHSILTYSWSWTDDTVNYDYGQIVDCKFSNSVFAGRMRGKAFRNLLDRPGMDLAMQYEPGMAWRLDPTMIAIEEGKERKVYHLNS